MSKVLADIIEVVKLRVANYKKAWAIDHLSEIGYFHRKTHSFINHLNKFKAPQIIAEIKFASPSEGDFNIQLNATQVAESYLSHGAFALSILTEETFFKGQLNFIKEVRSEFPDTLILNKDFIIDEVQIYLAKAYGADCILLMASLLNDETLYQFINLSHSLGLECLVEVHSIDEAKRVAKLPASLVGINNRNLADMTVDINNTLEIRPYLNRHTKIVSESGFYKGSDLLSLKSIGVKSFLIGTSFMQQEDPGQALSTMISEYHAS